MLRIKTELDSKADSLPLLPPIPNKRYFTIGEVGELCGVKPHVLRYYQHHEVVLIRQIRTLLYEEGFTISGAKNRLDESKSSLRLREELLEVLQVLSR